MSNLLVLEVMITWTEANYDKEATQALVSFGDDITASAQQLGTDLKFHYMNDAGSNQDVLRSYNSLERMKAVSRAYDPFQVFQRLQHGGFLLDKA